MRTPMTIADFLDRAELGFGAGPGVVDEPHQPGPLVPESTYGRFGERVRAWQAGFDALGVGEGERVAVVSHNSARLLELLFAVPMSGRICVPVNFRLKPDEVDYAVQQSGSSVLLIDPELEDTLAGVKTRHRFVLGEQTETELMRFGVAPRPWSNPDEDATATINFTSGTTARPKGVQLTHRNIWVNGLTFALHARVWERDVYLHTLPMFHCNGWGMPYVMAGLGVKQVVLRKVDGAEILRRVDEHGVTLMCGAPAVWNMVLDAAAKWEGEIPGRNRVRIICAGAAPPSKMIQRMGEELGWEFMQIYGLTETSPLLTFNRTQSGDAHLPAEERARKLSHAGLPALGVKLKISESGEVLARSNTVLDGYWGKPEETSAALEEGWFHTGDGGTIDATDGHLKISDRKKDVIITGGENVSSIEVEDTIFSHPAVAEVAVIGVPDEKWGETIKALVVLAEGATAQESDIIAHCKQHMAGYKAPTTVEFRDAIPRTATGKVQKFKLRQPYWSGLDRGVN
ncbi:AMP-binding protein [Streptomyces sp. NPDC015125]|uniref:AMP-binding protein n=1 Tax=Streptomyces sp. NPDC015125 TaxID=3364938 RepID=UPI0036F56876